MSGTEDGEPSRSGSTELVLTKKTSRSLSIPLLPQSQTRNQDAILESKSIIADAKPISISRRLFRTLGIESFYIMAKEFKSHKIIEERKIPIVKGIRAACYASLIHALPVMVSILLIFFNFRGYYIGGELRGPKGQDSLRMLGLQVAAKLIELMTVASLTCIIFALLRDQLLRGVLPFGTMTAGFEFAKISFLWSKEFVATCRGTFKSIPSKILVISTIVVFAILAVGIGPAAAVSCQPALQNWPAGGTTFYLNLTMDEVFPLVLDQAPKVHQMCDANTKNSCFPSNYRLLADELLSYWPLGQLTSQFIPENTLISGQHALRNLGVRFRGPFVYHPPLSSVTVPVAAIANSVTSIANQWTLANYDRCNRMKRGFCYYNDIFFSIQALQPVTYAACSTGDVGSTLQFPNVQPGTSESHTISAEDLTLGKESWFDTITRNGTTTALAWIQLPQTDFHRSSIGAVVAIPKSNTSATANQIISCTIDARWANATVTGTFWKGPKVVAGFPKDWSSDGRGAVSKAGNLTWPRIEISPTWAAHLNPVVDSVNTSAFSMLANSIGRANDITQASSPTNAVEAILGVMLADGLSRIASDAVVQGSLKQTWKDDIMPAKVYGNGGSAFDYTVSNVTTEEKFAEFQMLVAVNGYGYGLTTATLLSCLLQIVYSAIAIGFVAFTVYQGRTSSAWESIPEMVALAVNSRSSAVLQNTGAGIHSMTTLKEGVRIGSVDGKLELVFDGCDDLCYKERGGQEESLNLSVIQRVEDGIAYD